MEGLEILGTRREDLVEDLLFGMFSNLYKIHLLLITFVMRSLSALIVFQRCCLLWDCNIVEYLLYIKCLSIELYP